MREAGQGEGSSSLKPPPQLLRDANDSPGTLGVGHLEAGWVWGPWWPQWTAILRVNMLFPQHPQTGLDPDVSVSVPKPSMEPGQDPFSARPACLSVLTVSGCGQSASVKKEQGGETHMGAWGPPPGYDLTPFLETRRGGVTSSRRENETPGLCSLAGTPRRSGQSGIRAGEGGGRLLFLVRL